MKQTEQLFEKMRKCQLIALLAPKNTDECVAAYKILEQRGVVLEIALRYPCAIEGIASIIEWDPDALVLAGTVMTTDQAGRAIEAGASGIVSADYITGVVDLCAKRDIMCVPGGLSDAGKQLVRKAEAYGCSLEELREKYPYQWIYKLFPAFAGWRSNLELARSWRGPFRDLSVIYTGGITPDNLEEAVTQDPGGIFCGSAMTAHIDEPDRMRADVRQWTGILHPNRAKERKTGTAKPGRIASPFRVVTFGEVMARLSSPPGVRLVQAGKLDLHFGGSEANVAVSLARLGLDSAFVTVLPENDIGQQALNVLNMHGVDTRFVLRGGGRMGIYYLEHGAGPRPSKVIYDRDHSSIRNIRGEDLDWEMILADAAHFHWSGITPALGEGVTEALRRGLCCAREHGITVSVDLNYRGKLWSEKKAKAVMTELMPFVDIMIGNEEDAGRVFGIHPTGTDVTAGKLDIDGYEKLTRTLVTRFGFGKVAITLRESISASENIWSACIFNGTKFHHSDPHRVWIVDRVGSGDAFAAGLIYGFLKGKTDADALAFGVGAACLKHSILGDFNTLGVEEVQRFLAGDRSGRIRR